MKYSTFFTLLFVSGILFTSACKKESNNLGPCHNFVYSQAVSEVSENLSKAAADYGQDPTVANCEKFRSAYQSYIDKLYNIENCIPTGDRSEWRQSLKDAEQSLEEMECE